MANDTTAYMPLWVGDYLADTSHLTTQEHGTYLLLIMHYWRNGPLPTDKRKLCRITKQSRYTNCITILDEFFTEKDGRWHHKRIDKELEKVHEYKAKRSNAGKVGAQARWNSNRIANASDSQSDRNGTHNHNHNNKYIYVGDVFRITPKTMADFLGMGGTRQEIMDEVRKCDAYYNARITDGHEQDSLRYSSTAFFKLSSWLEKAIKNKPVPLKKPKISAAI